jgi:hypothetical protein
MAFQTNPTEALTTAALVEAELSSGLVSPSAGVIASIGEMITDLSQEFLQRCGVYSVSTLYTLTEYYNGSGGSTLALRQYYSTITSVTIGTQTVPQSASPSQYGWVLDSTGRFLMLRGYTTFYRGIQNVIVTGQAGASAVPGDVQRAMTRWVAIELKRKDSINVKTLALSGGGSTNYLQDEELPPDVRRCIRNHTLVSL